jgi:glycosyltransferase involved in cell wall biosynthesis
MQSSPLVSIVMPVYNAGRYIAEAIHSVLNQTHTNWELIIVDDGSSDSSYEVISSFDDCRIRVFRFEKNHGQAIATNKGLSLSTGDYIQFLDADDLIDCHKLEIQLKDLGSHDHSYIGISRWAIFYQSAGDAIFKDEPVYFSGNPVDWLISLWKNETMMPDNGYLIPRQLLQTAGFFNDEHLSLNLDFEYFTRIVLKSKGVVFSKDAICYYRKNVRHSLTFAPSRKEKFAALQARSKGIAHLLGTADNCDTREAARMALTILTYSYPEILPQSRELLKDLGLQKFGRFGGVRFRMLSTLVGFETAVRLKMMRGLFLLGGMVQAKSAFQPFESI